MENSQPFISLKESFHFKRLRQSGKRVYPSSWMMISYLPNQGQGLRCGWTVPKKIGKAVVRNRIKRWCREYFRKADFENVDVSIVFRSRHGKMLKELRYDEFKEVIERGCKKIKFPS